MIFKFKTLLIPVLALFFISPLGAMEQSQPHVPKEQGEEQVTKTAEEIAKKQIVAKPSMPIRVLRTVAHYKIPLLIGGAVLASGSAYSYIQNSLTENWKKITGFALGTTATGIALQLFKETFFNKKPKATIQKKQETTQEKQEATVTPVTQSTTEQPKFYQTNNVKTQLAKPEQPNISTQHPWLSDNQTETISPEIESKNKQLIGLIKWDLVNGSTDKSKGIVYNLSVNHPQMISLYPKLNAFYVALENNKIDEVTTSLFEISKIISPSRIIFWSNEEQQQLECKKLYGLLKKDVESIKEKKAVLLNDKKILKNKILKGNPELTERVTKFYGELLAKPVHSAHEMQLYLDAITNYLGLDRIIFAWGKKEHNQTNIENAWDKIMATEQQKEKTSTEKTLKEEKEKKAAAVKKIQNQGAVYPNAPQSQQRKKK